MKRHIGFHYLENPKHLLLVIIIVVMGMFGLRYSAKAYPEMFRSEVKVDKLSNIYPEEPIVIQFSQPVFRDEYEKKIKVWAEKNQQEQKISFSWIGNKRLSISAQDFWRPETDYTISIPESVNMLMGNVPAQEIKFSTTSYPRIKNFIPADGTKDVIVDMEEPLVADFTKSTAGFYVKFSLNPQSEVAYENNADKTQFRILPKEKLIDGSHYQMTISIKYSKDSDDNYQKIYESSFDTQALAPVVWEKDLNLRLEQAKKYTRAKILTGKYIDVNLSNQVMVIFENGQPLDAYIISSGKRGMETPKGEHQIYNKTPRAWSKAYGLYMPYWMAILSDGKVGIHELPEWPGGYKEGANHLGIPVSHGCVRLGVGSAERVYNWADIGTPVIVY